MSSNLSLSGSRAAARVAAAALAAETSAEQAIKDGVKSDAFVAQFVAMTPQQVIDYVNANITDLASAKTLLRRMAVMLLLLARREYKE